MHDQNILFANNFNDFRELGFRNWKRSINCQNTCHTKIGPEFCP